jgi:hypothetical protein
MPTTAVENSRAAQALLQKAHPALRRLSIEETDVAIVISGRVCSYYLKQLAQEVLRPLRGPRQLVNHIMVIHD